MLKLNLHVYKNGFGIARVQFYRFLRRNRSRIHIPALHLQLSQHGLICAVFWTLEYLSIEATESPLCFLLKQIVSQEKTHRLDRVHIILQRLLEGWNSFGIFS